MTGKQIEIMELYSKWIKIPSAKSGGVYSHSSYFDNVDYSREQGSHVYTLTGNSNALDAIVGAYSETNLMVLLTEIPELFSIVDGIASRVKNGNYMLVDAEGNEVLDNKLWNKITAGPNWQYDFKSFIYHSVIYLYITGNRYAYSFIPSLLKPKHENIQALWMLPSHYVNINMRKQLPSFLTTTKKTEYIESYDYTGDGPLNSISPELVTHQVSLKLGNSSDILTGKGVSVFKAASYPLANIVATYLARGKIFIQGGPLGAIVSKKSDDAGTVAITPQEREKLERDVYSRYGLGKRQKPYAISDVPVEYIKFGDGIKDLMPYEETLADTVAIAGVAGYPMALIPKAAENKQTNLDTAMRDFYVDVIIPESESVCDMLTKAGRFYELGYKVICKFEDIPSLQDDALKQAQAYNTNATAAMQLYTQGHITQNQLLERLNMETITGGDTLATAIVNPFSKCC